MRHGGIFLALIFREASGFINIAPVCVLRRLQAPPAALDLPRDYNVEKIEEYYAERPGAVVGRAVALSSILIRIIAGAAVGSPDMGPLIRSALEEAGPTFVKFGQALASRVDLIGPDVARELEKLQDDIGTFETALARKIIAAELEGQAGLDAATVRGFLASLSSEPVAAASISQVYRGWVPPPLGWYEVAVKVQRPSARGAVAADALVLRAAARAVASLRAPPAAGPWVGGAPWRPLVAADVVGGVDEFFVRLFEELDFASEARNVESFGALYDSQRGGAAARALPWPGVRVPHLVPAFCSDNVLTMEWVEGSKLAVASSALVSSPEDAVCDLALVRLCLDATLSQLLETGVMHADPHAGNLLRVPLHDQGAALEGASVNGSRAGPSPLCRQISHRFFRLFVQRLGAASVAAAQWMRGGGGGGAGSGSFQLCYLDLGLVSRVPPSVRDGLVSAVVLVVAKRYADTAALFGDLLLLPPHVAGDPAEMARFARALETAADAVLDFGDDATSVGLAAGDGGGGGGKAAGPPGGLPGLRFEALVGALAGLATEFSFVLPPYFLNNARALAGLEGLAKQVLSWAFLGGCLVWACG